MPAPTDYVPGEFDVQGASARGDLQEKQLSYIHDIPVEISAVLGNTVMPVAQLLRLGRGAVIELNRKIGEPVDILVNNRIVARAEVVVTDDRLGVNDRDPQIRTRVGRQR